MSAKKDVFICHANEDKADVVRPLVLAFEEADISSWCDEAEIIWGDSITQKVNEGLRISRYVIVVLSDSFLEKNWPQRELNSALHLEASTGEVRVLPLLAGTRKTKKHILNAYPILNDKFYLIWDGNPQTVVDHLKKRLGKQNEPSTRKSLKQKKDSLNIPLPKIPKSFTQKEKDSFLENSFHIIKDYFREALFKLQKEYEFIDTSFREVHNFKFLSTVYAHGEIVNKCKIWIGGPLSTEAIAYSEGHYTIDNDNSFNDWLEVCDDGTNLGFKASGVSFAHLSSERDKLLSPEEAAEYLWTRFTETIRHR
ncbi:MAG: hypothetical protein DRG59_08660 [Deltaproteobacteria bacterium]|nr:MAG: hypothetical protein DRG83_14195 [Deltaproteobacteria bacterium]RLB05773.1 MAG: hypothetical protein DRG59_08660 [Deltaproteobacteria bacterium]